ncbi:MAG: UDP-N-acetylmuramoyl-L-alanine--D-glutamate ligase [Candidatus Sungbacteria bacterium]|nr:UDP-N-acetylmuramoyl-L-alanine--D-glutamate ligase [Candidatus Sungbacteria bacterium]
MDIFRGKKITVMGLGLLGRGVGDAKFLAENGAELIVTDLKSEAELAPSLEALKGFPNITYVLGGHRLSDFRDRDFILKAAGIPLDSPFIAEARRRGIPVEMSVSLFARLTEATLIGVTGTRGKSTTTHLIYEILAAAHRGTDTRVFLGGNVRGVATLPLLPETKAGDFAVLELDSWQLQGFGEAGISPHIAVFTTLFADHQNYYKGSMDTYLEDKANVFNHQGAEDVLILGRQVEPVIRQRYNGIRSRVVAAPALPTSWKLCIPGEHNRENAALAREAARQCGVEESIIQSVLQTFPGVPGRLEHVADIGGVSFYNDTTATTPDAALAGLRALGSEKNIILIMGGADKSLDMSGFLLELPAFCKAVFVLPGTGTSRVRPQLQKLAESGTPVFFVSSMSDAVSEARAHAAYSDVILLSPAFASFGLFQNEFQRGDEFINAVHALAQQ